MRYENLNLQYNILHIIDNVIAPIGDVLPVNHGHTVIAVLS